MTTRPTWTYPAALRALWDRSAYERGYVADPFGGGASGKRGLRRVAALLDRLGRPQDRLVIVHVAGSKGKGSTSALVDAVLRAAGHRVGLFTSPHLHSWRERISVAGEPVAEAAFAALTARSVAAAEAVEAAAPDLGAVTTFELLTAMGLDAFAAAGCALAVVEVGLGGEYDATNVVTPLVAAITRLDLEHTAVLGDTLEAIAAAKAGILKPGRPAAVAPQPTAALAVIEATAAARGSPLLVGGRDWTCAGTWRRFDAVGPWGSYAGLRLGLPGDHQMDNAGTALAVLWLLAQEDGAVPKAAIRAGLANVRWPGRFERVPLPAGPTAVLDGAHTPAAAAALAATVAAEFPGPRAVLVLGTSADKDPAALARALAPVTAAIVATRSANPRAMAAERVAAGARAAGLPIAVVPSVGDAVARAVERAGPTGLVLVAGSLFVVAEAREALGLGRADPAPAPA